MTVRFCSSWRLAPVFASRIGKFTGNPSLRRQGTSTLRRRAQESASGIFLSIHLDGAGNPPRRRSRREANTGAKVETNHINPPR